MLKELNVDILTNLDPNQPTLILHGCNCFHTMGAGIAKYLRLKYPQVYEADKQTKFGSRGKLGTYSTAYVHPNLHILNCYTQYRYGRDRMHFDRTALMWCLYNITKNYSNIWKIRSSRIGCSNAGGNWVDVKPIFEEYLVNFDVTIYNIKGAARWHPPLER